MRSLTTVALGALMLGVLVHAHTARGQQAARAAPKRAPLASPADVEPAVDVGGPRVALIDAPPPALPAAPPAAAPAASSAAAAPKPTSKPSAQTAPRGAAQPADAASSTPQAAPAPKSARDGYARSGNHVNNGKSGIA